MRQALLAALLIAGAGAGAGAGCEGRKGEPRGLGPYQFGRMTAAQVHEGVCQPTQLEDGRKATWCFALPPIKVKARTAEIDAYFLGSPPEALPADATKEQRDARKKALEAQPLIEVQLKVRGCVEDELDRWMRERFGPPIETKSTREYWKSSFLWAAALMPSEPGRCIVHLLPLSENAEIERIKQK